MRRKLLAPAALAGVLLAASYAWAPPPAGGGARPPAGGGRPPSAGSGPRPPTGGGSARPPSGGTGVRPPIGTAKPAFHTEFNAARGKSAAEAAALLRTRGALLARNERAAMLNLLAHQMLRQRQAAHLADLRRLRTDWHAVGPDAGLDPIIGMELEAAESAAERLLLAEVLKFVADGRFADASTKLDALESPRYLSAVIVRALPDLRAALKRVIPFAKAQAEVTKPLTRFYEVDMQLRQIPKAEVPASVGRARAAWDALDGVRFAFHPIWDSPLNPTEIGKPAPVIGVDSIEYHLKNVADEPVAKKLRVEMAAKLFLDGRGADGAKLLEGEVDPTHAAVVLADVRSAALGRGEITTPQVAALVPANQTAPPAFASAVLPPDQLAKWKSPARKPGETTVDAAIAEAKSKLKAAVDAELSDATTKVNAAADRIRAALAAEAAPLKAFLEAVEAARGKPFASPAEKQLAAVAGTRGFTVAETVGVLAAEADRPAMAARLLATVPVFVDPACFATVVELSGRAPAAFKPYPNGDLKVTIIRDRARIRDAVAAILDRQAAKASAGQNPPPLERSAVEAEVAKRLGSPATETLSPAEFVQALSDVSGDWAGDYVRLAEVWREVNDVVANIEAGRYGQLDTELVELLASAKLRRVATQFDRKRREAGVVIGCELLGEYGKDAKPAAEWLASQGQDKPWRAAAMMSYARITEGK